MTSFSFFKYFDAFELDVNVVNFVYYEETRMNNHSTSVFTKMLVPIWVCDSKINSPRQNLT